MEVRRLGSVEGNLSSLALVSAPVGATAHADSPTADLLLLLHEGRLVFSKYVLVV